MIKNVMLYVFGILMTGQLILASDIPLPEHPRPDFKRSEWMNLNGLWSFGFDSDNAGMQEQWYLQDEPFNQSIRVPFSWGSPLSGVKDRADIGWYARMIEVPTLWQDKRIFLVVGASDWTTTVWLDGHKIGSHRGGYTPFEFELTDHVQPGKIQRLVLRVDDTPLDFKLEGKQGYGPARGIWQTPYLEARGQQILKTIHFTPDIDEKKVKVDVSLLEPVNENMKLRFDFKTGAPTPPTVVQTLPKGQKCTLTIPIANARLWTLDDPFLYEVDVSLMDEHKIIDQVETYFGMRKISVMDLPGSDYPYVALNNKPIYLQMTLDQAYHPEGYYTFPTDEFMKNEILRSRKIGLNGMRIHVKIGIPRKLYWADRLGMLIMADVPNSWGEPTDEMKKETKYALINMIERDYNHPSVFSWVIFNETWGLSHETEEGEHVYKPSTQEWVADMYDLAKSLDPTRLVEDNSPNKFDHVKTDLNTWHAYLAGYEWEDILDEYTEKTYPGSEWNYIGGRKQDDDPMFNSECGNVWGYKGSTGDVDWSWDYHIMMNEFRQHPLVCGWLYTEHHDVINEWNGYYRFDRSEKITGLDELVSGMTLNDLHAPYYISPDIDLCKEVKPGEQVDVPLYASFLADDYTADKNFNLQITLKGWNELGMHRTWHQSGRNIQNKPWMTRSLSPVRLTMPTESGLAILEMVLSDELGNVLHKNFTTFLITDATHKPDRTINSENNKIRAISVEPKSFARAYWSLKQWSVLDGLKVNGAGHGYFEYRIPWPKDLTVTDIDNALFMIEVSAKKLLGKDIDTDGKIEGSFMRGKGTLDPGLNRNAYPMTDTNPFPGKVRVEINNKVLNTIELKDDPADHRGILSWFSQKRDGYLREAGSYGYLVKIHIPSSVLQKANSSGELVIRLSVDEAMAHGLAIYGKRFGRYPIDPTVLLRFK